MNASLPTRIAVLLPCHNEAATIAAVVEGFKRQLPDARIYVFDNRSTDDTARIAAAAGAEVRAVPLLGKGNVVRRMFADVEADVYVMADGDGTYDAAAAGMLVDKLLDEGLDMVVGSRVSEEAVRAGKSTDDYITGSATPDELLASLAAASDKLTADFGTWRTPWGDINRFQRLTGDIVQPFNDSGPSIPVGFTYSRWGSLASFAARAYPGTKKRYGTDGNSFVAVVEFGDSVRARAVTAGGESGDPKSPHFDDQAERYGTGNLRDVYFYPSQLAGHTEREYHPGS